MKTLESLSENRPATVMICPQVLCRGHLGDTGFHVGGSACHRDLSMSVSGLCDYCPLLYPQGCDSFVGWLTPSWEAAVLGIGASSEPFPPILLVLCPEEAGHLCLL